MKELEDHHQDKPAMSVVKEHRKEVHVAQLRQQKGHTCFQLEIATSIISPAVIETVAAKYNGGAVTKRVKMQEGFLYTTALNKKNAAKHFMKMFDRIMEQAIADKNQTPQ